MLVYLRLAGSGPADIALVSLGRSEARTLAEEEGGDSDVVVGDDREGS